MKLYTLLCAVSKYPAGEKSPTDLPGAANDLTAMESFLREFAGLNGIEYVEHPSLRNETCTRQSIIDAFTRFKEASPGDLCLFYYTGHGGRMPSPKEFWQDDLDGKCETLVCYDSRVPGGRDLADKELAQLLHDCVPAGTHCLTIFDSCHSGSITREALTNVRVRNTGVNPTPVAFVDFYGAERYAHDGAYRSPLYRDHIALSACRDRQLAVEGLLGVERRGLFTFHLLETLASVDLSRLSYHELVDRVATRVANARPDQHASGRAFGTADMQQLFLSGAMKYHRNLLLQYDEAPASGGWFFSQGSAHGVTAQSTIEVRVEEEWREVSIDKITPARTYLDGMPGQFDKSSAGYPIRIRGQAAGRMPIRLSGELEAEVVEQLEREAAENPHIDLNGADAGARYSIGYYRNENFLALYDGQSPRPVFAVESVLKDGFAGRFLRKANHVGRYWQIRQLKADPAAELDLESVVDIRLEVVFIDAGRREVESREVDTEGTALFAYRVREEDDRVVQPRYRVSVRVKPTYHGKLYVGMLYFDETFQITQKRLPVKELSARNERPYLTRNVHQDQQESFVPLSIPSVFAEGWEVRDIENYLKIVVSEEDLQLIDLEQSGLTQEPFKGRGGGLESLIARGDEEEDAVQAEARIPRWAVKDITLRIVKPAALKREPYRDNPHLLNVEAPAGLELGTVTLASSEYRSRSLQTTEPPLDLSAWGLERADLTTSPGSEGDIRTRGDRSAKDTMVLYDVRGYEQVNVDHPLSFRVRHLNEATLVFGFDDETGRYYPVGAADEDGDVTIEQLPEPTPDEHTRSLGGSIKLYFQRIRAKAKGLTTVDLLREVQVAENFEVTVATDRLGTITQRVREARSIALFVHGIIGDNELSPGILRRAKFQGTDLLSKYDLVLTYDYENLGSEIAEIADRLQTALQGVGLGPDHGKQLHVYAHSMGGLVSRHFIELMKGDQVVNHLIQFGTPNNGSPLPHAHALLTLGMTYAINGLIAAVPWALPLLMVNKFNKGSSVTLGNMKTGSQYLEKLNEDRGTKVPYSLINGNTRLLLPDPNDAAANEKEAGFLARISRRFNKYGLLDLAFFRAPNDIAVSMDSQRAIPSGNVRGQVEVACDHLSYFVSPAGVKGLEEVLDGVF